MRDSRCATVYVVVLRGDSLTRPDSAPVGGPSLAAAALLVWGGVLDLMVPDRPAFVRNHEAPTDQESSTAVHRGS